MTTNTALDTSMRLDFCPQWCIGHDPLGEPSIVEDAEAVRRHLRVEAKPGDDLYCHESVARVADGADLYVTRADVIGGGALRVGPVRIVVAGDMGGRDSADFSLDAARALLAELATVVDAVANAENHR